MPSWRPRSALEGERAHDRAAVRPDDRGPGRGRRPSRRRSGSSFRACARSAGSRPSTSATTASSSSPSRSSSTSRSPRPSSSPAEPAQPRLPERDHRHRRLRGHADDHRRQLRPLARGDLRAERGARRIRRRPLRGVVGFPVAIVSGAAMGLINGLLVTKLRVNAFLATLATALVFGGIAVGVTNGGLLITPNEQRVHVPRPEPVRRHPVPRLSSSPSSRSCSSSCWPTPSSAATSTASATTATRPGCRASRSTGP